MSGISFPITRSDRLEPTSRGGFCYSDLIVADGPVDYPLVTGLDVLLALDQVGADASRGRLEPGALVLADARLTPEPPAGDVVLHSFPLTDRAIALGSPRGANMVSLGALMGLTGLCSREHLEQAVAAGTPKSFRDRNLEAVAEGYRLAAEAAGAEAVPGRIPVAG